MKSLLLIATLNENKYRHFTYIICLKFKENGRFYARFYGEIFFRRNNEVVHLKRGEENHHEIDLPFVTCFTEKLNLFLQQELWNVLELYKIS